MAYRNSNIRLTNDTHTCPWRASYGMPFVRTLEKIDRVITAPRRSSIAHIYIYGKIINDLWEAFSFSEIYEECRKWKIDSGTTKIFKKYFFAWISILFNLHGILGMVFTERFLFFAVRTHKCHYDNTRLWIEIEIVWFCVTCGPYNITSNQYFIKRRCILLLWIACWIKIT